MLPSTLIPIMDAAAAGENVVYGNATQREMLVAAGISRASVLIVSFLGIHAAERTQAACERTHAGPAGGQRTLDEKDFELLQRAGAAEVVPETLEATMILASHALIHAGVPINRVLKRVCQTRRTLSHPARFFPWRQ